jgi:hypothetical protein
VYLDEEGEALYRELFDYREDPLETENRAEQPGSAATLAELSSMIAGGWKRFRPGSPAGGENGA